MQKFYGRLKEQAENCSLVDDETTPIRDTFILNMLDFDTQKEHLKETESPKNPRKSYSYGDGCPEPPKINQNLNTIAQLLNIVNKFHGRNRNTN